MTPAAIYAKVSGANGVIALNRKGGNMQAKGRELKVDEAFDVLQSTATKTSITSWFEPFLDQMIEVIQEKRKTITMGGIKFLVKKRNLEYIFSPVEGLVPMTRTSELSLRERLAVRNESVS